MEHTRLTGLTVVRIPDSIVLRRVRLYVTPPGEVVECLQPGTICHLAENIIVRACPVIDENDQGTFLQHT